MQANHHEIEVTLKGKSVVPATIPELSVGDTVRYSFKGGGKVFITFPETSPFRADKKVNTQVAGEETLTVKQDGKFPSGCQILLPNGTTIGWNPKDAVGTKDSGGELDVRKKHAER